MPTVDDTLEAVQSAICNEDLPEDLRAEISADFAATFEIANRVELGQLEPLSA